MYLKESEVVYLIKNLVEQENDFSGFEEFDYLDALFIIFRNWVQKNLPEDERDYPMSYLLEKYAKRFVLDLVDEQTVRGLDRDDFELNRWNIPDIVKSLIKKGHYKFSSKRKEKKFTDVYKRAIPSLVENLELPSWVEIQFKEEKPYHVDVLFLIDYNTMLEDKSDVIFNYSKYEREIRNFVQNYLGVEIGNAAYGQLELDFRGHELKDVERWVKNVMNGGIKKEIKKLPKGKDIHSIRFEPNARRQNLKIVYKSHAGYGGRREIISGVESILQNAGYNPKRFDIENA